MCKQGFKGSVDPTLELVIKAFCSELLKLFQSNLFL